MFDRAAKISRTQVTKMRWVLGLHGLASVVFGVMILAWPGISVYALTILFGAYTLTTGILEFGTAFTAQGKEERAWLILRGLLGITVGMLVFAWPDISALTLLYVIGAYALAFGILCVGASFRLPLDSRDTASMILTGLVAIVFGIVIFAEPGAGALAVLGLIAAFALVTGISRARRLDRRQEAVRAEAEDLRVTSAVAQDARAVALTVDLLDRTSSEPASYSPAPRASADLPPVLERDVRFGAAVYGSFLAASVIGVAYESGTGARTMTASLLGSMLVFWAAHVWSEVVGERIVSARRSRPRDALLIARREWPLVEAAALPSILLALAWAGAWSRETGAGLALAAALVQVVSWGFAAGRRAGGSRLTAAVLAVGEGMLAVLLLAAERLVH